MKIQEKKIHIATVDRCVMCGNPVPEGKQVCGKCVKSCKEQNK